MRTIDDLHKSVKDLILLHAEYSDVVAKEKSLLGMAYLHGDHLEAAIQHLEEASHTCQELSLENTEIGLDIDYRLGKALEARATTEEQSQQAQAVLQRVITQRQTFDELHPHQSFDPVASVEEEMDSTMIYYDFAYVEFREGNVKAAIKLMEKCLALRQRKFGTDSAALGTTLVGLADLLREGGQYDRAKDCLTNALMFSVRAYGRSNAKVGDILNNLGNIQRLCAEFDASEDSLRECLLIRKEIFGSIDAQVAATLNNLAELFRERQDFLKAIDFHKASIETFESSVGPTHPGTINAKGNYGVTLQRLAKISAEDGNSLVNEALNFMHQQGYEAEHPWLVKFGNEHILQDARKYAQGKQYERSLALYDAVIVRKQAGPDVASDNHTVLSGSSVHSTDQLLPQLSISSLDIISLLTIEMERYDVLLAYTQSLIEDNKNVQALQALHLCEQFAASRTSSTNPTFERKLATKLLFLQVQILRIKGQYYQAMQDGMDLAEQMEKMTSNDDIAEQVRPLLFMARLLLEVGQYKQSDVYCQKMIVLLQSRIKKDTLAFGKASMEAIQCLLQALLTMSQLRIQRGNYDSALSFLERTLDLLKKHSLLDSTLHAEYLLLQTSIESVKGSHERIVTSLEHALALLINVKGKENLLYVQVLLRLADTISLHGAMEKALEMVDEGRSLLKTVIEDIHPQHPLIAKAQEVRGKVLLRADHKKEGKEQLDKALVTYLAAYELDHPDMVDALCSLGELSVAKAQFKEAVNLVGRAQMIHQKYYLQDNEGSVNNQALWLSVRLRYYQLYIAFTNGIFDYYAMDQIDVEVQKLLQDLQTVHGWIRVEAGGSSSSNLGGSLLQGQIQLILAKFYLLLGKFEASRKVIGGSGAEMKRYFQKYDAPLLYQPLLLLGEYYMETEKFRDAKVLFSFAYSSLQLLLGLKLNTHQLLQDTLLLAIENMRRLGYFYDAVEAFAVLTTLCIKANGKDSIEMLRCDFLEAKLARDRKKFARAELLYAEMERKISSLYSKQSLLYIMWKMDFGQSFFLQNKLSYGENLLQEAMELMKGIGMPEKSLWMLWAKCDYTYLKSSGSKPNELKEAMQLIKDQYLPEAIHLYGAQHRYVYHVKGRIALLMNAQSKGSGRKALFEVLKFFDEWKPFPLPYDHPYVLELGGYDKATSKDRLSRNINEHTLFAWSEKIDYVDMYDPNSAARLDKVNTIMPKTLFVDMKNNDVMQWGVVHYYGNELFGQSNMISADKRGRAGQRGGGDRSRSPSPSEGVEEAAPGSPAKSVTGKKSAIQSNAELEEALQKEIEARKIAEDAIVTLKHDKENLQDLFDSEKLTNAQLNKDLGEQKDINKAQDVQLQELQKQMNALQARLTQVEEELGDKIRKEQEALAKKLQEEELVKAEAKLRAERLMQSDAAGGGVNQAIVQPAIELSSQDIKDLEAAEFLCQRGQRMHDEGLYATAMPLLEESFNIRFRLLGWQKMATLDSLRLRAMNLRAMQQFANAHELFLQCLDYMTQLYGAESEPYLVARVEYLYNVIDQSFFVQGKEELEATAKVLANKIAQQDVEAKRLQSVGKAEAANTSADEDVVEESKVDSKQVEEAQAKLAGITAQTRTLNILYGRVFCLQAYVSCEEGKYNESKALIERGQAVLTKALGINNHTVVHALMLKAKIFLTLYKPKEAINIIEQAVMILKVVERANRPADENKKDQPKEDSHNPNVEDMNHPLFADVYLLFARGLMLQCSFTDAMKKLKHVRHIRQRYFHVDNMATEDIRLVELQFYEAMITFYLGDYLVAQHSFQSILGKYQASIGLAMKEEKTVKSLLLAQTYHILAILAFKFGDLVQTKEQSDMVTKQLKLVGVPTHILSYEVILLQVQSMHALGQIHTKELLEDILERLKLATYKEFVTYLAFQLLLGEYYDMHNESEEAERYYSRVAKNIKVQFTDSHYLLPEVFSRWMMLQLRCGEYSAAKMTFVSYKLAANATFGFAVGHEVFAMMACLEGKLLLYELQHPEALQEEGKGDNNSTAEQKPLAIADQPAESKGSDEEKKDSEEVPENLADRGTEESKASEAPSGTPLDQAVVSTGDGSLPQFNNAAYERVAERFEHAIARYLQLYKGPETVYSASVNAGSTFFLYLQGIRGQVKLMEFIAQQDFIQSLSSAQREVYFLQQQELERQRNPRKKIDPASTGKTMDPPGKTEIDFAIKQLHSWTGVNATHRYILELEDLLQALSLQFDDMQIAQMKFQQANQLKATAQFINADKLYDEAFILFHQCLGNAVSHSLIIAELLYEKAENSRLLGRKVEFVKSLHVLTIRVYRAAKESPQLFDNFILKNMLGMIGLFQDQHNVEDAISMLLQVQDTVTNTFPVLSVWDAESLVLEQQAARGNPAAHHNQVQNKLKVLSTQLQVVHNHHPVDTASVLREVLVSFVWMKIQLGHDYLQLYKYDDSLAYNQQALDMMKFISTLHLTGVDGEELEVISNTLLTEYLIRIYLNFVAVYDSLGHFSLSEEYLEQALHLLQTWKQSLVEDEVSAALQVLTADVLQTQAENCLALNKTLEAQQHADSALVIRVQLFNRIQEKPVAATATSEGSSKSKKKKGGEFEWTKEKQEEVRSNFLNAIDVLIRAGKDSEDEESKAGGVSEMRQTTQKPGVVGGHKAKRAGEDNGEGDLDSEMASTNKDIMHDFDSTTRGGGGDGAEGDANSEAGTENKEGGNNGSVAASALDIDIRDFMLADEKIYVYQTHKLSAHIKFAEIIVLQIKLAMLFGQVPVAKEGLEVTQQMLSALYSKQSLYKLKVQFYHGQLRFLQNHVEESKATHAKIVEQQLSFATSTVLFNLDISESYTTLARLHIVTGHYEDAMQYINDALKIERKLFHKYHGMVSNAHAGFGNTAAGGVTFASNTTGGLQSTLSSGLGSAGNSAPVSKDGHHRIQQLLVICAEILYSKGFYQDSLNLLDTCLRALRATFDHVCHGLHSSLLQAMLLKGRNQLELGHCEDALVAMQQSKSIAMVIYGEKHFMMGLIHYFFSQVMRTLGKLLECKQQLDLAITCIRSQLGKYHFYTIFVLLEIGMNFMDLGKYVTSKHVILRAMHLIKKTLGKDHVMIAMGENAYAELLMKVGLLDEVGEHLEKALYITRKVIGVDRYPLVTTILSNLHECKTIKGHFDVAIQGLDDTIALMKIVYNAPNHYQIAKVMLVLASTLFQQGKIYEAKGQYEKVYMMVKSLSSNQDHVLLYDSQYGIAKCLFAMGRLDQAKALLERCLSSFKDWKGSSHPVIASVLNSLADIYNVLQRLIQAESILIEAYTIRMKCFKECNEHHVEIAKNLLSFAENLRLRGMLQSAVKAEGEQAAESKSGKSKKLLISDSMKLKSAQSKKNMKAIDEEEEEAKEELDDVEAILSQADKAEEPETTSAKRKKDKIVIDSDSVASSDSKEGKAAPVTSTVTASVALGEGNMSSMMMQPSGPSLNMDTQVNLGPSHTASKLEADSEMPPREDDEESAPTVMISAIEKLDQDKKEKRPVDMEEDGDDDDEASLPGGVMSEIRAFLQDEANFKAIPLLDRALTYFLAYFQQDSTHPMVLQVKHQQAEVTKALGDYDKALEQHELLFQVRRKLLGDQHLDTITSLICIGDMLKVMRRVFPNSMAKPTHSSAHGAGGPGAANAGNNQMSVGGVSLLDHLTSITIPSKLPPRPTTATPLYQLDDDEDEDTGETEEEKLRKIRKKHLAAGKDWVFLTKPDMEDKKKPKPLPMPRGYMGYQFPPVKRDNALEESTGNMLQAINAGGNNGSSQQQKDSNPLHDPKKCADLAAMLLKKVFASEEYGITLKKNEMFDHPLISVCLFIKAEVARLRGDGVQAQKLLEQTLAMRRRLYRAHHPSVAECLYSMAELLRADQRYAQALPIFDKSLEIYKDCYGSLHPSIAEVENSMSLLYIAQGNYVQAQELIVHALDLCELTLTANHPSIALLCTNNANLFQAMGQYKDALAWYKKSLQMKQKIYGDVHPEIASTMNNMGLLYKVQGKLDEATTCYQRALDIQKQILGLNHPDIATTLNNFASILAIQDGKKFEAKEYFKQSLSIRTFCYGAENTLVASTMNNYAGLLYQLGEVSLSKEMFEESLRIRKKLLGEEHPAVAESLHNLGFFYYSQNLNYEAKLNYDEAIRIRRKIYDAEHLLTALTALHLSQVCEQLGEMNPALELAREAYAIREKHLGDLHADAIAAKKSLKYIEGKYQQYLRQQQRKGGLKTTSSSNKPSTASATAGKPASTSSKVSPVEAKQSASAAKGEERPPLQFEVAAAGSLTLGEHHMD